MQTFKELINQHQNIYLFEIEQGRVLFHLLPYQDYASYRYMAMVYPNMKTQIEDEIWDKCVVEHSFGVGQDYIEAGVITTIANLVLHFSCSKKPADANTILEASRESLRDAVQQAILFICEAFPSYLPEHLEKMNWYKLMKRLAQAEMILDKTFEFKDPASQKVDDSGKIFNMLDEMSDTPIDEIVNAPSMDFDKMNQQLMSEEFTAPSGDFNLHNIRG
jgi:hypothetical protein